MDKNIIKTCKHHGDVRFILEGRGSYRCTKCRMDAVTRKRKKIKIDLLSYFGGKCKICSYDKCKDALEFHHLDPTQKEFGIGNGDIKSFKRTLEEAKKCILVCCRCHREIHAGLINIGE